MRSIGRARGILVLAAAAVVVASNAWTLVSSTRNRSEAIGGTVELTERELRLPPLLGDSTALFLELKWDVPSTDPGEHRAPDWLTPAKLEELGFDCRMPPASPDAHDHYSAVPPVPVYLVLEYEGDAWKNARFDPDRTTRLFAVDAGREASRLRDKYRDPKRNIIVQATVRLMYQDRSFRDGKPLPEPRLRGRIETILPDGIFVPRPHCRLLQDLRGHEDGPDDRSAREPRFAVKVSWGRAYEPWVEGVRLLTSNGGTPREPR